MRPNTALKKMSYRISHASMKEEWHPILGYENSYALSNHGRIKSLARTIIIGNYRTPRERPELIIKLLPHNAGYRFVFLHDTGIRRKFFVHRLVAAAFLPNDDELPVVNHKDRDKSNNHVSNLEWMTYSQNTQHYVAIDRVKAACTPKLPPVTAEDLPW